jgi:hypothetical protein
MLALSYSGEWSMASWAEFERAEPEMAAAGRRLIYQYGTGLGFLATVRKDGGPRLHPVCPILCDGDLYVFIVEMSPKKDDLLRDGRYALHAFTPPGGGEEFYVTGRAAPVDDPDIRAVAAAAYGNPDHDWERLFAFSIERVLHTEWDNWGTPETWPRYQRWKASNR